jgi:hypothetical protein
MSTLDVAGNSNGEVPTPAAQELLDEPLVWRDRPEDTASCRCGTAYRSQCRIDMKAMKLLSRKPCPGCGKKDDLRGMRSDRERMS